MLKKPEMILVAVGLCAVAAVVLFNVFTAPPLTTPAAASVIAGTAAVSNSADGQPGGSATPSGDSPSPAAVTSDVAPTEAVIVAPSSSKAARSTAAAVSKAAKAEKTSAPITPVNINTADATQLDTLPGIGPVMAQRIIDYRNQHGPFLSVDELDNVSGIGPKTLEKLRPYVYVK